MRNNLLLKSVILSLIAFNISLAANTKRSITTSSYGSVYAPGDLVFEDNFDTLNYDNWDYEANMNGGGLIINQQNNEFQIYDRYPTNAYVKDGKLHIKPSLTLDILDGNNETLYNGYHYVECCTDPPKGGACDRQANYADGDIIQPVVSARLRTKGRFSFRYGKVEVRAKIPRGDWMWPAIWMLPEDAIYGVWPTSGEIDIMESRGNRLLFDPQGVNVGTEQVGSTLHFGPFHPHNAYELAHNVTNSAFNQGFDRDFHIYKMEWTDSGFQFTVDDRVVTTVNPPPGGFYELGQFDESLPNPWVNASDPRMAPFDEKFHFIVNVAVGGHFFDLGMTPERPWGQHEDQGAYLPFWEDRENWLPSWEGDDGAMQIDYIRVWAV